MRKRNPARIPNVICTIIFGAFTFLYLYCFQSDMLAYAQYVLAEGATTYNALVGSLIITVVMLLLSMLTASVLSKNLSYLCVLSHVPSILVLAAMTDINIVHEGEKNVFGNTWLVSLLIFIALFILNSFSNRIFVAARGKYATVKCVWINLLLLFVFSLYAVACGNTSKLDHLTIRSEQMLVKAEYDKVNEMMEQSSANTSELTAIKAFSLANTNQLGECFFRPFVTRESSSLLPMYPEKMHMFPVDRIYKALGGIPTRGLTVRRYLDIMNSRGTLTPMGRDYLLTACLMDCDLKSFAAYCKQWNRPVSSMQKNYSEAMALYTRLGNDTISTYKDARTEENLDRFLEIKKEHPDRALCENALRDAYSDTYWFYYFFTSSRAFTQSVSSEK